MRLLHNKKGQIRVIEAFFASMLLLSVLTLIPSETKLERSDDQTLISMAYHVLLTLDNNGYLSKLIENSNWTELRQCIQSSLPSTLWFNLTIFDENMSMINEIPISSGSLINDRLIAVQYVCASQNPNYNIYVIRMQLAVVS